MSVVANGRRPARTARAATARNAGLQKKPAAAGKAGMFVPLLVAASGDAGARGGNEIAHRPYARKPVARSPVGEDRAAT
jgi:hypothetical protein